MRRALLIVLLALVTISLASDLPVVRSGDFEGLAAGLERDIFAGINAERQAGHFRPLSENERLRAAAREHSKDMARRAYFSHEDHSGGTPTTRIVKAGVRCTASGENIYQNNLYSRVTIVGSQRSYQWNSQQEIANSTVRGWMNSSGHRRNILDPQYRETGIGVAVAPDGKVYVTQDFCTP